MQRATLIAALLAATLPVRARAGDPAVPSAPLEGALIQGDAVYRPGHADDCAPRELHDRAVVFVNFDGGTIFFSNFDDATQNRSWLWSGEWPAYGDGPQRDEVMELLRGHWADFNVVFTDERPGSGPYTMVMVGPEFVVEGGALGVAPVDCNDTEPANIVYAFVSADDGLGPVAHAWTISHEVAHSYGLDHVTPPDDVMHEKLGFGDPSFQEACSEVVGGPNGVGCPQQHAVPCSETTQSSWQDLHLLFGDRIPDELAPTVSVISPEDQAQLEANAKFTINIEASDDTLVDSVEIRWIDGAPVDIPAIGAPFRWTLEEGLPEGGYSFYAVAHDLAGNVSYSEVVNIGVGDVPPPDIDEIPEEDMDTGDDGGTSDEGGDAPGEPGEADGGCGCQSTDEPPAPAWALLIAGAILRRRR